MIRRLGGQPGLRAQRLRRAEQTRGALVIFFRHGQRGEGFERIGQRPAVAERENRPQPLLKARARIFQMTELRRGHADGPARSLGGPLIAELLVKPQALFVQRQRSLVIALRRGDDRARGEQISPQPHIAELMRE